MDSLYNLYCSPLLKVIGNVQPPGSCRSVTVLCLWALSSTYFSPWLVEIEGIPLKDMFSPCTIVSEQPITMQTLTMTSYKVQLSV